jgi:hypothetical protein
LTSRETKYKEEEEDPDHNSANLTAKHLPKPLNHTKLQPTNKKSKEKRKKKKRVHNQRKQEEPINQKVLQGKKSLFGGSSRSLLLVGSRDLAIDETAFEECKLDLSTAS